MKFSFLIILITFFSFLYGFDYSEKKKLDLSSEGIERLEVDCSAGFLKITGSDETDQISVKAEVQLDNVGDRDEKEILEKYLELSLEKRGNRAELISDFDHQGSFFSKLFGKDVNESIDLTVKNPKRLDVEVDDGSGFIKIKEIDGSLRIDDGSGEMVIKNIGSDVEIDDGSGELWIENIGGKVWIDDGSGELHIEDAKGDVWIEDGSGSLYVRKIKGSVKVDDGSGSIEIEDVEQDVEIIDDGSGSVDIRNVKGKVYRKDD